MQSNPRTVGSFFIGEQEYPITQVSESLFQCNIAGAIFEDTTFQALLNGLQSHFFRRGNVSNQ